MVVHPFVTAIIAAAGNSSRMNGTDKLTYELLSVPVIVRTLKKISECVLIDEVIVACNESNVDVFKSLIEEYGIEKVNAVVPGGKNRFESVQRALEKASEHADYILIHDGARPLIKKDTIVATVLEAFQHAGAAAGVRFKDTIKEVENGYIIKTPQRERLWAIHTPQVFEKNIYVESVKKASQYDFEITDDSMLVELNGVKVRIIEDDYTNIKITTPEDLITAEQILLKNGD